MWPLLNTIMVVLFVAYVRVQNPDALLACNILMPCPFKLFYFICNLSSSCGQAVSLFSWILLHLLMGDIHAMC